MLSDVYKLFIENNIPKNTVPVADTWEAMEKLNTSAKQTGFIEGRYICMLDAMRINLRDIAGERSKKDTDKRTRFLCSKVPAFIAALLPENTKKSLDKIDTAKKDLAKACDLSDQFSDLFKSSPENADTCITVQIKCADVALENEEFVVAFCQYHSAATHAAKYLRTDAFEKRPEVVVLRNTAMERLISLAETVKEQRPDIAGAALEVIRGFASPEAPLGRTPYSDLHITGKRSLVVVSEL